MSGEAVLFLDVDGVLNCTEFFVKFRRENPTRSSLHELCPDRIALLNELVQRTGCSVTVSSTWRRDSRCRERLRANGFTGQFSRRWRTEWMRTAETPDLIRGDEIADWLERYRPPAYAIVDDDSDMLPGQMAQFVQTDHQTGLRREHVERLVGLLNLSEVE